MKIQVTQEDIDDAVPGDDGGDDPLQKALLRTTGKRWRQWLGGNTMQCEDRPGVIYTLYKKDVTWLDRWFAGKRVRPTSMFLSVSSLLSNDPELNAQLGREGRGWATLGSTPNGG